MEWLTALLTWMSAEAGGIEAATPRAAACVTVAYSTLVREPVTDTLNEEEDEELDQPGGGVTPAQEPKKRMVKRCVNGRCVITYE